MAAAACFRAAAEKWERGASYRPQPQPLPGPIHQFHLPPATAPYGFLQDTGIWYISEHLYQFGTVIMTTCHGLRRGKIPSQVPGFERG